MTSNIPRRACLLASAVLLLSRRSRGEPAVDDVLARIDSARATVRTIQGPFTQVRTIGLLLADVRSRGTLSLVRPDRLRWKLDPPDDVTFWMGPEGLAYRGPHGQGRLPATTARIAAALDDMRALLGGDLSRLRERWLLRVLRDDAAGVELEAVARASGDTHLRSMRFALAADRVRPTHVLFVEDTHDRTAIEFGDLVVNAVIDDALMRPPP
ncbi:MAG: outer membrane lipoprotein carrier protein LolA [Polyangiaceae bacterium]|jgi:outer membrane lipoprotein carrier protein LolA